MYLTYLLERQKENEKIAIKYGTDEIKYKDWYKDSWQLSETLRTAAGDSYNIYFYEFNRLCCGIFYNIVFK